MCHNMPVAVGSTLLGETEAESTQRLRPAQKSHSRFGKGRIDWVLSGPLHFLSPSAQERLIPTLNSLSHLVDHTAFLRGLEFKTGDFSCKGLAPIC
jgi:hypothetical protein